MKTTALSTLFVLSFSLNAFTQVIGGSDGPGNLHDPNLVENFMICNVSISKNGEVLKKHLVTTYHPSKGVLQVGSTPYHYASTVVSNCVFQAFEEKYNKRKLFQDKKSKTYIDLCYKIGNGVEETKDGYAEFYLVQRPKKEMFKMNYLNLDQPLKVTGNDRQNKLVGDYEIDAQCENKMLSPIDELWSKIKKDRLGNFDNTLIRLN